MFFFLFQIIVQLVALAVIIPGAFLLAKHDEPAPLLHEDAPTTVDIPVASENISTPSVTPSKKKANRKVVRTVPAAFKPETGAPEEIDRRSDAVRALAARKCPPGMEVANHGGPGHDSGGGKYKKVAEGGWQRSHVFKTGWQTIYGRAA